MKKILTTTNFRRAFFYFALTLVLINSFFLIKVTAKAAVKNRFEPPFVAGYKFFDFVPRLSGVERAGFLTDKTMSPEKNDGEFLGAQYMLAPVILDLNNTHHRYLILDYTNLIDASKKLKEIKAKAILMTREHKILAEKRP